MNPSRPILLIASNPRIGARARELLEAIQPVRTGGEPTGLTRAGRVISGCQPSPAVVLLAASRVGADASPAIRRVLSSGPAPVLLLTDDKKEASLLAALRYGAAGYLHSDADGSLLEAALEAVAGGQTFVDPHMAGRILSAMARDTWPDTAAFEVWNLRPREQAILQCLVAGRSNREIARELSLGEQTIKTHLRNLYRKLGARSRSEAVAIALGRRGKTFPGAPGG